MKFIFPQNYNFKNKLLGIIDYTTIIVDIIWCLIIFLIVYFFIPDINVKIFVFISFSLPIILFSISGFNGESFIYVFSYMIRFVFKQKKYFFSKKL